MHNTIYFIAGKGGSGKDTVASHVSSELNIPVLPVYVTRNCRPDDKYNVFTTKEALLSLSEDSAEVRSYSHVEGEVFYATKKADANEHSAYVAVGPSEMYVNFLCLFKGRRIVPIVLDVSFDNRLKRMHGRDHDESVRRVRADDLEWLNVFDGAKIVDGNRQYWAVVHDIVQYIRNDMNE